MTAAHRQPRNAEQATALCGRYSHLAGELALVEATRTASIAAANKSADAEALPILDEMSVLAAKLEPWWATAGAGLVKKDQKSIELGGCMIGTKIAPASLAFPGTDKAALAKLLPEKWAKPYIRVTLGVNKVATLAALDGDKHANQLKALGFSKSEPGDTFFVKAAAQQGAVSAA